MRIILLGLLLLVFPAFGDESSGVLKYYYIPFQIETYKPVTMQNIKDKAQMKGVVTGNDASKLLELLTNKKQAASFDKKRVRLLVETEEEKNPIFVDAAATVLNGQDEYAMNPRAFAALKKMLASLKSPK